MKSEAATEYIASIKAQKEAAARLQSARAAVVAELEAEIKSIVNSILPKYPQLAFMCPGFVDTAPNMARKRPKPDQGGIYVSFWINPHWKEWNLTEKLADRHREAFRCVQEEAKNHIILQLEMNGRWKFVDGSMFFYNDGPGHGFWSHWAMVPIS